MPASRARLLYQNMSKPADGAGFLEDFAGGMPTIGPRSVLDGEDFAP